MGFPINSSGEIPARSIAQRIRLIISHADFWVMATLRAISLERTKLRSGLQVWLFAPESIGLIPKLAAISSSSPIEKYLPPELVNWKLMETSLWRWIAMVLLALVLAAFSRWITRVAIVIADLVVKRTPLGANNKVLRSFAAPFQLVFPVTMFRAAIPAFELSALLRLSVGRVSEFLLIAGVAWLCARIVDAFIVGLHAVLVARKGYFHYSTLSLASRILKLAIPIFALTALLGDWGYSMSTILAGLGVVASLSLSPRRRPSRICSAAWRSSATGR